MKKNVEDRIAPSQRGGNTNQKEIEKYIKFFVLKALQAVVSSRIGIHNKTRCRPAAKGQDWFNISLHECEANKRLQSKIRELFGKRIPTLTTPICLDVVLRTFEGSFIVLETWQLSTAIGNKEMHQKNHFSIYNRLGVLLKSVLSISRVLPSFNLAKKNEKDFSLFFKVHSELYTLHRYEMHNIISIGCVKTPVGTVNIKVMYRSKIWLSGSFHAHTYTISNADSLLPLLYEKDGPSKAFQSIDMFENELALAVSDTNQEWINSTMSISTKSIQDNSSQNNVKPAQFMPAASIGPEDGLRHVAAFVEPFSIDDLSLNTLPELPQLPQTPPFQSLFTEPPKFPSSNVVIKSLEGDNESEIKIKSLNTPENSNLTDKTSSRLPRHAEAVGFEDDFVLVELRPAFFSEDDSVGNLYKQCQSPVPLEIFSSLEEEDEHSESIDLDTQLEKYRKELQEYQDFFSNTLKSNSL